MGPIHALTVARRPGQFLPTMGTVRLWVAPAMAFVAGGMDRGYQTDFWHHLARGREIVGQGGIVDADLFTFTLSGHLLRDNNWLSQVMYYRLFAWGGLAGVQLANALLLAAAMAVLVRLCRRASGSGPAASAAGVIVFLGIWQLLLIRPQTLSLLLFGLIYSVLSEADASRAGICGDQHGPFSSEIEWRHVSRASRPCLWHGPKSCDSSRLERNAHGRDARDTAAGIGARADQIVEAQSAPAAIAVGSHFARWRFLVIVPLLTALWANLHGGFPIGLVLIGAFTAGAIVEWRMQTRRDNPSIAWSADAFPWPLALCFAASIAATLLNPYGWRVYQYVGSITSTAAGRHIEEWLPPTLHSGVGLMFWASVPVLAGLFLIARRRPTIRQMVMILCFLPLACRSVRMVAWWFLAMAPIIATLLRATFPSPGTPGEGKVGVDGVETRGRTPTPTLSRGIGRGSGAAPAQQTLEYDGGSFSLRPARPSFAGGSLAAVLLAICVLSLPQMGRYNPLFGSVRSANRMEDNLRRVSRVLNGAPADGRVFSRLEWGEYLDWSLGPCHRVFMDGRIEAYSDGHWQEYCTVTSAATGWQDVLDRYQVNWLLLDSTYHHRLLRAVRYSARWKQAAASGPAILFARHIELAQPIRPHTNSPFAQKGCWQFREDYSNLADSRYTTGSGSPNTVPNLSGYQLSGSLGSPGRECGTFPVPQGRYGCDAAPRPIRRGHWRKPSLLWTKTPSRVMASARWNSPTGPCLTPISRPSAPPCPTTPSPNSTPGGTASASSGSKSKGICAFSPTAPAT